MTAEGRPETAGYEQVLARGSRYRSPRCAVRQVDHPPTAARRTPGPLRKPTMGKGQGNERGPESVAFLPSAVPEGRECLLGLSTKCRSQASSARHFWVPSRADPTVTPKVDAIRSWQQGPCIRGSAVVRESHVLGHIDLVSRPCPALPVYHELKVAVEANNKARLCVFMLIWTWPGSVYSRN